MRYSPQSVSSGPFRLQRLAISGLFAIAIGSLIGACSGAPPSSTSAPDPAVDAATTQVDAASESAVEPEVDPAAETMVETTDDTGEIAADRPTGDRPSADRTAATTQPQETAQLEVGDDGEPNEPLTVTLERLELQSGMPYSEARSQVMSVGWQPYTAADGATPDTATTMVRELHALGFEEAQSCSGTGQGFCAFEFTHISQPDFSEARLVIITTPSMDDPDGEPLFYDWRIDGSDSTTSAAPAAWKNLSS